MRENLSPTSKSVIVGLTIMGTTVALNRAFDLNLGGIVLLKNSFLFFILAAFLPIVFIAFAASKSAASRRLPVYDAVLASTAFTVCFALGLNGENIITQGWDFNAPTWGTIAAIALWGLVLEALRRTAGMVVTVIALAFSLYPMVASAMPWQVLRGPSFSLERTAQIHAMGSDSILGLPLQVTGTILIGFLIFGVILQHSGGSQFFYDLAQAAFGRYRGGSAKVSIFSSGLMGMVSGSAVSNVLTTGPMTIPAMKRSGFTSRYAAAVEASASTGGTITPPLMGSAAFLMVSFIGVPYSDIALAAAIPAFLFFLGIFVQIDAYSAKQGFVGGSRSGASVLGRTLVGGWPYVTALVGLVALLVLTQDETQSPFWVVAFLLVFVVGRHLTARRSGGDLLKILFEFMLDAGKTIAQIVGIIAGVGLIVGGLSMTGVSLSLARELVSSVGGSVILILLAGAITSFVLGMGMTVSAVYVLLAIVMAPALVKLGVDPIAAHLFVIYWATVSYITPPVAVAAFAASGIAKSPAMSTAFIAMRLGAVKYLVPFAFVYNPALVAQAGLGEIAYTVLFAAAGVFFLGCAFEGWAIGGGCRLTPIPRALVGLAGLAAFIPEPISSVSGIMFGAAIIAFLRTRSQKHKDDHVPTKSRADRMTPAQTL